MVARVEKVVSLPKSGIRCAALIVVAEPNRYAAYAPAPRISVAADQLAIPPMFCSHLERSRPMTPSPVAIHSTARQYTRL